MIRPLRQQHRRITIVLGLFLPIAFALGIAARKPVPNMDSLPANLLALPQKFAATECERANLFVKSQIRVRLQREQSGMGRFAVEFSASKDFVKPDLMVYWVPGDTKITDTLPNNAQGLGTFNVCSALALPADFKTQNGRLVLYSLADNEVIEVSKPFSFTKP